MVNLEEEYFQPQQKLKSLWKTQQMLPGFGQDPPVSKFKKDDRNIMSEIYLNGPDGVIKQGKQFEWGLDGWSDGDRFGLAISSPDYEDESDGLAYLDLEHCSKLVAALVEHTKEVQDAGEKNIS